MKGQTAAKGTPVYSYKWHMYIDKIATVVTIYVYIKYINDFKKSLKIPPFENILLLII